MTGQTEDKMPEPAYSYWHVSYNSGCPKAKGFGNCHVRLKTPWFVNSVARDLVHKSLVATPQIKKEHVVIIYTRECSKEEFDANATTD